MKKKKYKRHKSKNRRSSKKNVFLMHFSTFLFSLANIYFFQLACIEAKYIYFSTLDMERTNANAFLLKILMCVCQVLNEKAVKYAVK